MHPRWGQLFHVSLCLVLMNFVLIWYAVNKKWSTIVDREFLNRGGPYLTVGNVSNENHLREMHEEDLSGDLNENTDILNQTWITEDPNGDTRNAASSEKANADVLDSKVFPLYQPEDAKYVTWVYSPNDTMESKLEYFNDYITNLRRNLFETYEMRHGVSPYGQNIPCTKDMLNRTYITLRGVNAVNQYEFTSHGVSMIYFLSWQYSKNDKPDITDIISKLPIRDFYHCVKGPELVNRYRNYSNLPAYVTKELCLHDCSSDWADLTVPRAPLTTLFYSYDVRRGGCANAMLYPGEVHLDAMHSMDIIHNSFIERNGCVVKDEHWLCPFAFGVRRVGEPEIMECYLNNTYLYQKEVFVATQRPVSHHDLNFAHIFSEMITKLVPFLSFLKRNPDVSIHVPTIKSFVPTLLSIFELKNKFVDDIVFAETIYMPHGSGVNNLFLTTALAANQFFKSKIQELYPENANKWDTVLFIKRRSRKIQNSTIIEEHLQKLCQVHNFRYYAFDDTNLPTFQDSMLEFHRARLVIGPHGAGLANLLCMKPGSAVIEIMCTPPWPRTTFSNIALRMGLRYYVTMTTATQNPRRCNKGGLTFNLQEFYNITNFIFENILVQN